MPHQHPRIYAFAVAIIVMSLPACLLSAGPGPGSTVCDGRGNCVVEGGDLCEGYGDPTSCDAAGCAWSLYCEGTAAPCAYLGPDTCDQQQGCGWDDATGTCGGSEGPCEAFAGTACGYQIGCQDAYGCSSY